jgi:hypothetical protein
MAHRGKHTSSSKESLRLIKVHEGRCKDVIVVSSFYGISYFTTKALGATFATNVDVQGEDYALRTLYQVVANNPIPPCLDIPWTPLGFETDSWYVDFLTTLL